MSEKPCSCSSAPKLIFSCAGAADVGEIADRAVRKLHKEGAGKLYCLAGIGAGLNNFIDQTKSAPKVLVIDGCPVDCAKKLMEKTGYKILSMYGLLILVWKREKARQQMKMLRKLHR